MFASQNYKQTLFNISEQTNHLQKGSGMSEKKIDIKLLLPL